MHRVLLTLLIALGASVAVGFVASEALAGGEACDPGQYKDASGACVPADPGHYADGSTQTVCPPGYYQSQPGMAHCDPAPAGGFVSATGQLDYQLCPPGYFQPLQAQTGCVPADPGHYVDIAASPSQEKCPVGRYQPAAGATGCIPAAVGHFVGTMGATDDLPCSVGHYAGVTGLGECTPASAGSFVGTTGATDDTPCPAGTYQPEIGQGGCVDASPGHHVRFSGSAAQSPCPAGRFQPAAGSIACREADVGFFVGDAGAVTQTPAPAGSYVPVAGRSEPTPCPIGTYQPEEGQGDCVETDPGHYAGTGAIEQEPCPEGTFQPAVGADSCISASPGHFVGQVIVGTGGNVTGFEPITGAGEQTPCPVGFYQPGTGQSDCIEAEPPEFVDVEGATHPSRCEATEYRVLRTDGSGGCVPCPTFGVQCASGFITSDDGFFVYRDLGGNSETYDCPVGVCLDDGTDTTTTTIADTATTLPQGPPIISAVDDVVNHFGSDDPVVDLVVTLDRVSESGVMVGWQLVECADGPLQCPTTSPTVASGTFEFTAGSTSATSTYSVPWDCSDPTDDSCNRSFLLALSDPVGGILGRPVAAVSVYGLTCPAGEYRTEEGECIEVPAFGATGDDGEIITQDGFYGPTEVGIESEYVYLTTVEPSADGIVTVQIVAPAGIEPGDHQIVFRGIGRFGIMREVRIPVTVASGGRSVGGGLPWLLLGGFVVAGSLVVIGLRRRAESSREASRQAG